jgi:hypothetical protein
VTNCLNFGSPEDPEVMWQLAEAVRGLADGCKTLGIPVTGGNVSFYNQTGSGGRPPHPGDRGARRARRRAAAARRSASPPTARGARAARPDRGRVRRVGLGARCCHGISAAGRRPRPGRRAEPGRAAGRGGLGGRAGQAHDLSDGGLAVALAESCLRGGTLAAGSGCPGTRSPLCSASRPRGPWWRSGPAREADFDALRAAHGVPGETIGRTGGGDLVVEDCFAIPLAELAAAHTAALPALFG